MQKHDPERWAKIALQESATELEPEPEPDLEDTEDDTSLAPEELANVISKDLEGEAIPDKYKIEEESGIVKPYEPTEEQLAEAPISEGVGTRIIVDFDGVGLGPGLSNFKMET